MAGNPFRRAQPNRVAESGDDTPSVSNTSGKKVKKVVILSPPQSPEEVHRRLSAGRISPPPPAPEQHDDDGGDSDSTATADSELEEATLNTRRNSGSLQPPSAPGASASGAPYNPFARTLATSEAAFGLQHVQDGQEEAARANGEGTQRTGAGGRPAMDVDAFKNILMTGSAVPSPPTAGPSQRVEDGNSSTDVSSMSRHSFDPYLEINQETPRTSFDDQMGYSSNSEDDEEGSSLMSGSERLDDFAPPAPPKPGQRKPLATRGPQTVSFADFEESIPSTSRSPVPPVNTSNDNTLRPQALHRSPSDLNKPLPPPPQDLAGPESSTLNVPVAPTTTEPSSQIKKAPAPPPPPASRRAGHAPATQGLGRSSSNAKPNSEEASISSKPTESAAKSGPVPPPPPSRKSRPISQSAAPSTDTPPEVSSQAPHSSDAKSAPMPPPPPRRNPSKAGTGTSVNRTSSTASRSSVSRKENQPTSNHNAPAPPPPRRGGNSKRESMDGPPSSMANALNRGLTSDDEGRRGSQVSVDSGKWNPSQPVAETAEPLEFEQPTSPSSTDILADMNALQAEIDALRAKAGRG